MSKVSSLNAIYLASIPITGIYLLPGGFHLSWILFLLLFIVNFFSRKLSNLIYRRKNEIVWFFAISIIGLLGALFNSYIFFNIELFINNYLNLVIFFLSLIIFTSNCNVKVFIKALAFFGIIASLICLFQRAQLLLTGSFYKNFFIPGLEISRDIDSFSVDRVSSIFTEPAHLSIYLLPISYFFLLQKKFILFVLMALGIFFSGSSTGFLLLLSFICIYMITGNFRKIYLVILLMLGFVLFYVIMLFFPDVLIGNVEKLNSTNLDSVRLLGPLYYLSLFDVMQWCFGIGLNQLSGFLNMHGLTVVSEWGIEKNANYANAFIFMLLSYGIFGLLFSIKYFYKSIRKYQCDLGFLVYILGILLSDQVLFNRNLLFILCFMIFAQDIKSLVVTYPNVNR